MITRHQVVVISGETGCGKTTQVCKQIISERDRERCSKKDMRKTKIFWSENFHF